MVKHPRPRLLDHSGAIYQIAHVFAHWTSRYQGRRRTSCSLEDLAVLLSSIMSPLPLLPPAPGPGDRDETNVHPNQTVITKKHKHLCNTVSPSTFNHFTQWIMCTRACFLQTYRCTESNFTCVFVYLGHYLELTLI